MGTEKEEFGRSMRAARKARGLRQGDVAAALDVDVKQVGRWEKGVNTPGALRLKRFVQFLRQLKDGGDLAALEQAITFPPDAVNAIDQAIAEVHEQRYNDGYGVERARAAAILTELTADPGRLRQWLDYGDLLVRDMR